MALKRILLIDDDLEFSEMIQVVLGGQYQVECQPDHINVSQKLRYFLPHLILLDNSVRKRHETGMMNELRDVGEHNPIPVVLFSAQHDIEQIAVEIKADGFLAKPFDLGELHTCINKLIA